LRAIERLTEARSVAWWRYQTCVNELAALTRSASETIVGETPVIIFTENRMPRGQAGEATRTPSLPINT